MVNIVVAPERLEEVAGVFEQKRSDTEAMIQSLKSTMDTLDAEWDGVAQNKFYNEWNEMIPKMSQFTDLLQEIAGELRHIAQTFREVDEGII